MMKFMVMTRRIYPIILVIWTSQNGVHTTKTIAPIEISLHSTPCNVQCTFNVAGCRQSIIYSRMTFVLWRLMHITISGLNAYTYAAFTRIFFLCSKHTMTLLPMHTTAPQQHHQNTTWIHSAGWAAIANLSTHQWNINWNKENWNLDDVCNENATTIYLFFFFLFKPIFHSASVFQIRYLYITENVFYQFIHSVFNTWSHNQYNACESCS